MGALSDSLLYQKSGKSQPFFLIQFALCTLSMNEYFKQIDTLAGGVPRAVPGAVNRAVYILRGLSGHFTFLPQ